MVAIETKTIENYVKKGVPTKVVAKEHGIDENSVKWLFEGIQKGILKSSEQEFVYFS